MTASIRPATPIKAVLFDWGGVMSNGGRGGELAQRLAHNLGMPDRLADTLIANVWDDFSTGKIDEAEVWRGIEAGYGKPIGTLLRKIWNTWHHTGALPEMKALVRRLRKGGYRVGLVSNTIPPTAAEIRSHGGYDLFEFAILSYEVGVAKPDKKIYELAMQKLPGITPEEVVFIDDQQRCLVSASQMGMHTIHAQNPAQVVSDLQKLLSV